MVDFKKVEMLGNDQQYQSLMLEFSDIPSFAGTPSREVALMNADQCAVIADYMEDLGYSEENAKWRMNENYYRYQAGKAKYP